MIRELKQVEINGKNLARIITWKADLALCDLIMSKPINLTIEEAMKWVEQNSIDECQEFLGIHINDELVGIGRLMFINFEDGIAEIGLYLGGTESRGAGLGKFTLNHLENLAKNKWGLNKVFARVRETNLSSERLFKSHGFITEGLLKNHYKSLVTSEHESVIFLSKFLN